MGNPDLNELFKIHNFNKVNLVTRARNPLDKWKCTRCNLSIEMGLGWYRSKASSERLRKCKS